MREATTAGPGELGGKDEWIGLVGGAGDGKWDF